jgi:DNA-binding IclR family transcriptional regulator
MRPKAEMSADKVQMGVAAVHHVADILQVLRDSAMPLGVNEIARRVSMHKSTVSRVLATLEHRGFVEREGDGVRFKLGIGLISLIGPLLANLDLVSVGRPILATLAAETGETAGTCIWSGRSAVMLDEVRGSQAVAHYVQPGRPMPAHCSAGGKCFLAHMDEEHLNAYLAEPLMLVTPYSITDPGILREELARVLVQGHAVNVEELEADSCAVAAPIANVHGRVVAALLLAVPKFRFNKAARAKLTEAAAAAAATFTTRMGGLPLRGGEGRRGVEALRR